ncbi:hypothetical protein D3C76_520500 [compost metagenome]
MATKPSNRDKSQARTLVVRALTTDEFNQIAIAAHDSGQEMEMALHELLSLGFRAFDVAGAKHGVGNSVVLRASKSSYDRDGHFPTQSVVLRSVEFSNAIPGKLLFPRRAGPGPLEMVRIARIFHRWVLRAGLGEQGVTLHAYRRSVMTQKLMEAASSLPG